MGEVKMREKDLWALFKKNIPGHLVRIENIVTKGVPDVHCSRNGKSVWVELKITNGTRVYFQPSQIAFFEEAKKHQEIVKVFVRHKNLLYLINTTTLLKMVYEVNKSDKITYDISQLAKAHIWGQPYDWKEIYRKLYDIKP
jgi:penicillin-binding protein-related factor A (putative recombinase)|tara:strand:+ start:4840 stop:5262 length:423 start_codon:yes stop_codon:yes gene_type:complete